MKHTKEIVFIVVFILFLFFMYYLYFPSSLVEPFQEGISNAESDNPVIQIGKNSSTINSLRERIDSIDPDKILKKLDDMTDGIKANAENITQLRDAQSKMGDALATGDTGEGDDDEDDVDNDESEDTM